MFGRMTATPLVRLDAGNNLDVAVAELLATTEYPQIARWIQFPTAYQEASFTLHSGDLLVAFTDGISEAMSPEDKEWGEERMIEAVKHCDSLTAARTAEEIMRAADVFAAGAKQYDDMTLVVMWAVPPDE